MRGIGGDTGAAYGVTGAEDMGVPYDVTAGGREPIGLTYDVTAGGSGVPYEVTGAGGEYDVKGAGGGGV